MGGKTSTSTQQVSIPPQVLAQYQSVNEGAENAAQTGFQSYGGIPQGTSQQLVAPVNQEQTSGIEDVNAGANIAQGSYDQAKTGLAQTQGNVNGVNQLATGLAAGAAGAVNPTDLNEDSINKYMSPYLQDVVGTESGLLNQNNQQQQAGQLGTAISSGAFGSDRTGIAAANLSQQQNLSNANIYANLLNTGYNNALSTAQQQQGVGLAAGQANRSAMLDSANALSGIGATTYGEGANTATTGAALGAGEQSAALQGANAKIAAGTVQQQTQQATDTADYNQFLQQQSYPYQVAQFLANIAEGTGSLSGSTTTTQQPGGFFSDRRLKYDIKKIGETYDKQPIYSYKMHGDKRTHVGLIAQNVEKMHPDAVGMAAGFKTVDYGKATEKSAAKGRFQAGGVVSEIEARRARADGGSLGDVLEAQRQMYGGGMGASQQQRNISTGNSGAHQLTVASGSPPPAENGAGKVTQGMNLVNNGNKLYKSFNTAPSAAPSSGGMGASATTGVNAPVDYGYQGATTFAAPDATATAAPAVEAGGADAAAGDAAAAGATDAAASSAATGAASSAAGAAAGTAAAGAAEYAGADAAAEAAAALAAEYAAAEVGTAVLLAKRGGRINRDLGGGIPYGGDDDIPNDPNTHTMAKPGPLVKSKTGLQTLEYMGQPDNAMSISGDMFSNEALRRGGVAGGRRGYADGGDPTDDAPEPTAADATADTPSAGGMDDSIWGKIKRGAKAVGDNFKQNREAYVPLLEGLGAMGTAKTRDFGTALAAGMGAAGKSYVEEQTPLATSDKLKAETQGVGLENQLRGIKVDWAKGWDKGNPPPAAQPTDDQPLSAQSTADQVDAYYRNKFGNIVPTTPQETARNTAARKASVAMGSDQPINDANAQMEQRRANELYQKQQGAQHEAMRLYSVINDPSTTPDEKAAAQIRYNAVHQFTGEKLEEMGGDVRGNQTGLIQPGQLAATLSPDQRAGLQMEADRMVTIHQTNGQDLQVPFWSTVQGANYKNSADYVARNSARFAQQQPQARSPAPTAPPAAAAAQSPGVMGGPAAPPVNAPSHPGGPVASPAAAAPTAAGDKYLSTALNDPKFDLPVQAVGRNATPVPGTVETAQKMAEARVDLKKVGNAQIGANSMSRQFLMAAKDIMQSKGAPVVGAYGGFAHAIARYTNDPKASSYQEVAKNLVNAATTNAQSVFKDMTQKEWGVHLQEASPNIEQQPDALMDLIKTNLRGVDYNIKAGAMTKQYADNQKKDPTSYPDWLNTYFPRDKAVNLERDAPAPGTIRNGFQYKGGPAGERSSWAPIKQAVGQ